MVEQEEREEVAASNFVQVVTIQINFSMNELAVFDINNNSLSPGE